jgi:hypothetical protein
MPAKDTAENSMHEHGPNCLEGPIRGSRAWWLATAPVQEPAREPAKTDTKKSAKAEQAAIRQELVDRVRREIKAGTYDTPEKWQAALDCLLERLD